MTGTILDVVNGLSVWLLVVDTEDGIVNQPIEPRFLRDLVAAEELGTPYDLVGREVELAGDGMTIRFPCPQGSTT